MSETSQARIARTCPACASQARTDLGLGRDGWVIARCDTCRFVYLTEGLDYAALSKDHGWETSVTVEAERRKRAQPVVNRLDRATRWRLHLFKRPHTHVFLQNLKPGGRILDLGCGDGRYAAGLPETYTPFGIEISEVLAARADDRFRPRGGACMHAPTLEGLARFEPASFDGVMLNSYLEHELEPLAVLDGLARVMKDDAVAVIKVPNFATWNAKIMGENWCGIRIPDHLNYFTPASMQAMAQRAGFGCAFPSGVNLPTNDNMWAFLTKAAGPDAAPATIRA